jgi:hypothetical protein
MAGGQIGGDILLDQPALLGIGHAAGIIGAPGHDARKHDYCQKATPAPKHGF